MKRLLKGGKEMARKINGPFCDVSIQTIGSMGSTSNNNDVFFNLIHSEMAMHSNADEFSSTRLTQFVDRIKKRANIKKSTKSSPHNSENLDPTTDLYGPTGFNLY